MKRILILSHMFPNKVNPVAGIFVFNQAKALQKAGYEVRVVVPTPSFPFYKKWKGYRSLPRQTELEGIPVYYIPTRMFPGGFFFYKYGEFYIRSLRSILKEIKHDFDYDLLHCHTIFPDGYAGGHLKEELGVPVGATIHGSDIMVYPKRNRRVYENTVKALKTNDWLITVSEKLRDEVSKMVKDLPVTTIYNGFNPDLFSPMEKHVAREKLGIHTEGQKILFVGNLIPIKGVNYLLEAFQLLKEKNANVDLYLIGAGSLRHELQKKAEALGIGNKVHFMGRKPYEEISVWINSADVVALTSLSEGLPSILLETMGCGRPMVATDVGGIKEILQDGVTGRLAQPQNSAHIAECLADVLSEGNAEKLGKQAYLASKTLTWETNIKNTEKMYISDQG